MSYREQHETIAAHYIGVGKKGVDFIRGFKQNALIAHHEEFSIRTLFSIAQDIANHIMEQKNNPYTSVVVYSNEVKNFFVQRPIITSLIPLEQQTPTSLALPKEGYVWEQQPEDMLVTLSHQYIESRLQFLLFQSLLAEHAARFISMDNSTRNAQNLLETTRLSYNKLRQANITKELTELIGGF